MKWAYGYAVLLCQESVFAPSLATWSPPMVSNPGQRAPVKIPWLGAGTRAPPAQSNSWLPMTFKDRYDGRRQAMAGRGPAATVLPPGPQYWSFDE